MCLLTMGNSWVFGNNSTQDNTPPQVGQSTVALIAAQRTTRKQAAASGSQPAAQGPEPAAQGPESEDRETESVGKEPGSANANEE